MGPHEKAEANVRELNEASQEELIGNDLEELDLIRSAPGSVVLQNPKRPQRLKAFTVVCIICNRMIGKYGRFISSSYFEPVLYFFTIDLHLPPSEG